MHTFTVRLLIVTQIRKSLVEALLDKGGGFEVYKNSITIHQVTGFALSAEAGYMVTLLNGDETATVHIHESNVVQFDLFNFLFHV